MTDLRFADDIAVLAENVTDLQEAVDRISMPARGWACGSILLRLKRSFWEKETSALTYK